MSNTTIFSMIEKLFLWISFKKVRISKVYFTKFKKHKELN